MAVENLLKALQLRRDRNDEERLRREGLPFFMLQNGTTNLSKIQVPGLTDKSQIVPAPKKDKMITIDKDKARITGLAVGTKVKESFFNEFTKFKRAEVLSSGQGTREADRRSFQKDLETEKQRNRKELETFKTKSKDRSKFRQSMMKVLLDEESDTDAKNLAIQAINFIEKTGEIPEFTEEQSKFFGIPFTGKKAGIKEPTKKLPPTKGVAEGSILREDGVNTHTLRNGKWDPLN